MRLVKIAFGVSLALGCLGVLMLKLGHLEVQRLAAKVDSLEKERKQLAEYIDRLQASVRIAQADIVHQLHDEHGHPRSTIRWLELLPDGTVSEPQMVETKGDLVYFEAAVIKFQPQCVGGAEPGRERSLAIFRRIFGDMQTPALVPNLEPFVYANQHPQQVKAHEELWELFWRFMDDPVLAEKYCVRTAQVEAPAVRVREGQIWEVTLDAAGGLNVRLIGRRDDAHPSSPPIALSQ